MPGASPPADFCLVIDKIMLENPHTFLMKTGSETDDVIKWCKAQISDNDAVIERTGKNLYVTANNSKITINAHSYTVITAHKVK